MKKTMNVMLVVALAVAVGAVVAHAANTLPSPTRLEEGIGPGVTTSDILATEQLFKGDMTAEIGLGCSNPTGNSGGPNDVATRVTASLTPSPQLGIIGTTYNIFTQNGYVTAMNFMAWTEAGGVPAGTIGSQAMTAGQFVVGTHTVAISPAIWPLPTAPFFIGFYQPQTAAGMRWGMDTSGGGTGDSYIRAPSCGASSFTPVTSLGFPGNWVVRVVVDNTVPVELQSFSVE